MSLLGVSLPGKERLKTMASSDQDYHSAFEEGLQWWISNGIARSWEELISAVESCGDKDTAIILRKRLDIKEEAAKTGNTEVVKLLLKENVDVNVQDEEGVTALMIASENGHTQVVDLLLKANVDVNVQDEEGVTALMIASENGHTQVVESYEPRDTREDGSMNQSTMVVPLNVTKYFTWKVRCKKMALIREGLWDFVTKRKSFQQTKQPSSS
ncbi:ankyrin repeat, SAM and basic leucine zipper domain-containing protein 1-like [Gigantopelta aegis]|uniref:ankyrin repeat, SAM and basic leucine zipper domain-containing protein 1-like n=1 Tax=Gigantopelta aegis TaxID=1735272 RepID=UPI001B88E13A|nr:ankyrin repeat, SAM and basic leucine zipper domain-containing protein 1-like [Gigantopelta aegis]